MFLESLRGEGIDFSVFPIPAGVEHADSRCPSHAQQRVVSSGNWTRRAVPTTCPAPCASAALDRSALERAFAGLVARHASLRTVFDASGERLQLSAQRPLGVAFEDCSAWTEAAREEHLRQEALAESLRPFDLEQGPLLRVRLIRLGAGSTSCCSPCTTSSPTAGR